MTYVHRRLAVSVFAVLVTGSSLQVAPAAAEKARRIATLAPEGSRWMKQLRRGAAAIEKATEGRVTALFYAGGTQGDEKDVVRKMGLGQLDGAALTSLGLGLIVSNIRVLQLPGFYASVGEVDYVRRKMWPHFQKLFRKRGYELLAAGDVGWIYLFSTKAVRSESDLSSVIIWRWDGDPSIAESLSDLEVKSVSLGVPEVSAALTTGRVQAAFNSPLGAIALQWHTSVKYMSAMPVAYGIGGMVVRKKVWDGASAADKAIQMKIGRKQMVKTIKLVRKDNKRAIAALKRHGVRIVATEPALQKKLTTTAEAQWRGWVPSMYTAAELEMALRYRDEYRAANPTAPRVPNPLK